MRSKRTCPACPRGCPSAPSPPPARAGGLEATYPPPHRHQHHFLCFPPHRFPRPHCEGKSCRSSSPSRLHRHPVHLKSLVESCQNYHHGPALKTYTIAAFNQESSPCLYNFQLREGSFEALFNLHTIVQARSPRTTPRAPPRCPLCPPAHSSTSTTTLGTT